jgi:geranylgeranyl diphosphate synthase type II
LSPTPAGTASASEPRRARARKAAADPLGARRAAFERYFARALAARARGPGPLGAAVRYAALSPGKRLRPLLALAACEAVGGPWRRALPAAAAIEAVHAFSLVHDDLPAMDDDDFRRGLPTTHKRYGEALAILAGDALLAFAFGELTELARRGLAAARAVEAVRRLAAASGAAELIAGQARDLEAEGRRVEERELRDIHLRKTGALFGAALALGGIAGGGRDQAVEALDQAGRHLGLAFQIRDDVLNVGSSLERLGKRPGTDTARGKATYPAVVGQARAKRRAAAHLHLARAILEEHRLLPRGLERLLAELAARER